MTAHRDPDRLIHEFLLEGADRLHDQVYDAVRADIEHRRQRAVIGPWRMPNIMNKLVPIGLGAAAVVGALAIGTQFLGAPAPGGVGADPTAPASPQPTPAPIPESGEIEEGTYLVSDGASTMRVTFPAGWDVVGGTDIRKHRDQPNEVMFLVNLPDINVWPDACATGELPPRTGPTADDLVAALRAQQNSDVSAPAEIMIGGLPGFLVEISVPDGFDTAACIPEALRIWSNAAEDGNFLAFDGPGTAPVYILETPSGRIVLSTGSGPEATASDLAELQAIIDSIQIEPAPGGAGAAPTAAPSASPAGDLPVGSSAVLIDEGGVRATVTIPAPGWFGGGGIIARESVDPPAGAGMITFTGDLYVYGDPCTWSTTVPETPAATVDELAAALAAQASRDASEPVDVTVGGYAGKSITLHVPDDADFSACDQGYFGSWGVPGSDPTPYRYHQGPGQVDEVWILDVNGVLTVIDTAYYEGTPAEQVEQLRDIVASATFEAP